MTVIQFSAWRPDVSLLNGAFTGDMVNVLTAAGHLIPFPTLTPFTTALESQPFGGITARDSSGGIHIFAGTAGKLFKLNTTTLAWADVSQAATTYAATAENRWWFKQWGNFVVCGTINDAPQVYKLGVSALFEDLAGSPPNASGAAICGDHMVLFAGRTFYYSDTDDIEEWSAGNSGSQTFPDGGPIFGVTDTTNPLIFQKQAIRAGTFIPGSPFIFSFQKIHDKRGVAAPYSIATRGEFAFFADSGAFYQITSGGQILPIGKEKVDRTIFGQLQGDAGDIFGEVDPFHTRVYWAIRVNSTSTAFDRIVVYDWDIGEWTQIDTPLDILLPLSSGTIGYTLEGLDALYATLEDVPFSLDSRVWQGGAPVMAAFDTDFKLGFFSGGNAEAIITTQETGAPNGSTTYVDSVYPLIDIAISDTFTMSHGTREQRGQTVSWSDEIGATASTGRFDVSYESNFHRYRFTIPSGSAWTAAQGADVDSGPAGWR